MPWLKAHGSMCKDGIKSRSKTNSLEEEIVELLHVAPFLTRVKTALDPNA